MGSVPVCFAKLYVQHLCCDASLVPTAHGFAHEASDGNVYDEGYDCEPVLVRLFERGRPVKSRDDLLEGGPYGLRPRVVFVILLVHEHSLQ